MARVGNSAVALWDRLYCPGEHERAHAGGRIYYWDNVKFVAIALVVIGHFVISSPRNPGMDATRLFIYLFHMPLFVFVSGYFSKSFAKGNRFRFEKVLGYLFLYVVLKGAILIENYLLTGKLTAHILFYETGLPWYMLAMAAWLVAVFLLKDVKHGYVLSASVVLAVLSGYHVGFTGDLCANRIVTFAPFFFAGFYLNRDLAKKALSIRWLPMAGAAVLALGVVVTFAGVSHLYRFVGFVSGLYKYESLGFSQWGGAVRLLIMVASSVLGLALMSVVPRARLPISPLGGMSLQIYFLHRLIYPLFAHWGVGLFFYTAFPSAAGVLVVLSALLVTLVLSSRVFSAPFTWIMGQKFEGLRRD